jgi:phosphohistidine phosphatase SixA
VAQIIGQTIQDLDIPIGRVFSSKYCRTRETHQCMGLGPVTATPAIMNMRAVEFVGDQDAVTYWARVALS